MHRTWLAATACVLTLAVMATTAGSMRHHAASAEAAGGSITVKARLIGWVARRDGYHLYREGATVRAVVSTWPNLRGEEVRARLEWRRPEARWRLLDVTSTTLNRDSRGSFLVRGLPAGYAFRIRAKVPAGEDHRAGRSPWRYFRVR